MVSVRGLKRLRGIKGGCSKGRGLRFKGREFYKGG